MGAALALCRALCTSGRVRDALNLVQDQTSSTSLVQGQSSVAASRGGGGEQSVPVELQMWLTVMVGAVAGSRGGGLQQSQQQRVGEAEVERALRAWAGAAPGVDQAQVGLCVCGNVCGCTCMHVRYCFCLYASSTVACVHTHSRTHFSHVTHLTRAQVHASLSLLHADLAAADGQPMRSMRLAAAAVHVCPTSVQAR